MNGKSVYSRREMGRRTGQRGGFTLVELLVVVSIIALLIAILLPSLKRARAQAKDVMCKANLKSVGQAFDMYAESYGRVWPPAVDTLGMQNRWPVPFHKGGIITAELARFDDDGQQLKPPDKSIFLCPSERAPRIIPDWKNNSGVGPVDRVEVGGSYSLNEEMHRRNGKLFRGMSPPPEPGVPPFINPVDNCRRSAEVYLMMDNFRPLEQPSTPGWRYNRGANENSPGTFTPQPGAFWVGYRLFGGQPVDPSPQVENVRIIGGRHSGKGNALCIDTHAESYAPDKVPYNRVSWNRWPKPEEVPPGGL